MKASVGTRRRRLPCSGPNVLTRCWWGNILRKWNHKGIVEQIRQSLRHSDGAIQGTMAGEQSSVCA